MNDQSPMIRQLYSIPELMKHLSKSSCAQQIDSAGIKKVILTGCGDSFCAAMAGRLFFQQYTELEAEVDTVIELSRNTPIDRLVQSGQVMTIIISNSGRVSRCIELAERIRRHGGHVMAVTGNQESPLAKSAEYILPMDIPEFVYAPGIRSYTACLCTLYQLAVCCGCRNDEGRLAERMKRLQEAEELIRRNLPVWDKAAERQAAALKDNAYFEWIGSGAGYVNAWFSQAKLLETAGKNTNACSAEDWFHMHFFAKDVYHTAAILFCRESGRDAGRLRELRKTASEMGRPLLCICEAGVAEAADKITNEVADKATDEAAKEVTDEAEDIRVPPVDDPLMALFIDYIPAAFICAYIGELLGESYFRDGKDNWAACVNSATIVNSKIEIE